MRTRQRAVIVATAAIALLAPAAAGVAGPASASTVASTAGVISTLPVGVAGAAGWPGGGGRASRAGRPSPGGAARQPAGTLRAAGTGNHRGRVVAARSGPFYGRAMPAGDIYPVAGDGTAGFSGDGGPATSAE